MPTKEQERDIYRTNIYQADNEWQLRMWVQIGACSFECLYRRKQRGQRMYLVLALYQRWKIRSEEIKRIEIEWEQNLHEPRSQWVEKVRSFRSIEFIRRQPCPDSSSIEHVSSIEESWHVSSIEESRLSSNDYWFPLAEDKCNESRVLKSRGLYIRRWGISPYYTEEEEGLTTR